MIKKLTILTDEQAASNINAEWVLRSGTDLKYVNRDRVSKEYIEFVGELNFTFNSLDWWAGSIGSKNQYISHLYKNICYYIEIINHINRSKKDELYVVLDNEYIIKQLGSYCKDNKISFEMIGERKQNIIIEIFRLLKDNFSFFSSNLKSKGIIEKQLRSDIKRKLNKNKENYVLRTWVDKRSFDDDQKYNDIYYGELLDYLKKKINVFSICVFLSAFEDNLAKVKYNNSHYPNLVIPIYYFQKPSDYLKVIIRQFRSYLKLQGNINNSNELKFQSLDIKYLLLQEINDNLMNGDYRDNLLHFYTAKNVALGVNCKGFVIPYENHSWEILSILAFRKWSPKTHFIGYQHASISRRLFNYFLGKKDRNVIPLPSRIITVGPTAERILRVEGNFPAERLAAGPAFRFQGLYDKKMQPRRSSKQVLVAFSIGLEDSINFLIFMIKALAENSSYSVLLKCHPAMPIDKILSAGKLKLPNNFQVITDRSISQLLDEVDMLVYSDTTASMEALMVGIPVIYLDIDDLYEKDSLFECNYLKWTVRTPDELRSAIDKIYNMTDPEFKKQQQLARKYMENYFFPVTESGMKEFINDK